MNEKMAKCIEEELQATPTTTRCEYKVGDIVTYTNEYGVSFEGLKVIGFSKPDCPLLKYGKFINLDSSCYWMPVEPESLCFGPAVKIDRDLILANGQKAIHKEFEFFGMPVYELENGTSVCCVNNDGSYLHTMSKEGEPISPLPTEYQALTIPAY